MTQPQEQTKVTITKLTIKIGGRTVQISKEEAKQLKEALDEIFPTIMEPINIHWHHDPVFYPGIKYPRWEFGNEIIMGGTTSNTCHATLEIKPEGSIIT